MMEHDFCRLELSLTMADIRKHTTSSQRKGCWGYKFDGFNNLVAWYGPDGFYWEGRGCCLWAARSKGWDAWMSQNVPESELLEPESEV